MDIGEFKRTTIVRPAVIPVPQREREHQTEREPLPIREPEFEPAEVEHE